MMKKLFIAIVICTGIISAAHCQSVAGRWREQDRQYLLENLTRSRDLVVEETGQLSAKQWRFKESTDRWSIGEVVEHINIYELLWQREVSLKLASPAMAAG